MVTKRLSEAEITGDREIALHLLQTLVGIIGDPATMTVDLWKLHKVILAMRAIVVEADETLTKSSDFDQIAATLSELIAEECRCARIFRQENGIGLMDLVLQEAKTVN